MGAMEGSASEEIDAPISEVWAVVEDVASAPQWQGGMDSMEVRERDDQGRAELCETATDVGPRTVRSVVRFEYEPEHRLTWTQVKGDLKHVVGSWELEDLGGGRTRATYELKGDPGRILGMLARGPVGDKVRAVIIDERPAELKRHVEAG
jgi:carbon monoxide dehydrogenase subunit G